MCGEKRTRRALVARIERRKISSSCTDSRRTRNQRERIQMILSSLLFLTLSSFAIVYAVVNACSLELV